MGGAALIVHQELDPAAAGVLEGVAGDLRNRGGDPRLILVLQAKQPGDLPGALPSEDDILLQANLHVEKVLAHESAPSSSRATSTVTSSRSLWKSR